MEELPHLINQCLSIVPDEQLIKRYLYSFLLNSHSVSGPDDDWNRFQHHDIGKDEMYTLAGKVFTEYLRELEGSSTNDNK